MTCLNKTNVSLYLTQYLSLYLPQYFYQLFKLKYHEVKFEQPCHADDTHKSWIIGP